MGLFWADGYLNKISISIEMVKEDLQTILPIFNSLGEWNISTRKRNGRREQMAIKCHSNEIKKYLKILVIKIKAQKVQISYQLI